MADYQKMYALLCGAVDDVIDPLEQIPWLSPMQAFFAARWRMRRSYTLKLRTRRNKPQIFMRRLVDDPVL